MSATLRLVVRRVIHAPVERVFAAWTEPEHFKRWWGPRGVRCSAVSIDLRVGGRYRIANTFPDGVVRWISGEFERVDPPHELVYSWQLEGGPAAIERVSVRFVAAATPGSCEVVVTHERIGDDALREQHERGWVECLEGLAELHSAC